MSVRIPGLFSVSRKELKVKQLDQSKYNKRSFLVEF